MYVCMYVYIMRKLLGVKFNVTNIYMSTWVYLYDSEYYDTDTLHA